VTETGELFEHVSQIVVGDCHIPRLFPKRSRAWGIPHRTQDIVDKAKGIGHRA
jgi:hypothetical protein